MLGKRIVLLCFLPFLIFSLSGTCKDILLDRPDAENGVYIYKDPNGNDVKIFCDFYGDYGYTFFSSASLTNISSLEPHFTTSSEAIIRHFRSDGSQTEAKMKIISRYRNQYNLTFLLNEEFDEHEFNAAQTYRQTDEPYLTLGFVPLLFGSRLGTIQGYSVDGTDIEFINTDDNPSNSIKFYLTPLTRDIPFDCCDFNTVKSAWYDYANVHDVAPNRYLQNEFSFRFMVLMGGGGAFWTYDHFEMGVALGLKFSL